MEKSTTLKFAAFFLVPVLLSAGFQSVQAKKIIVNPGDNLNAIVNNADGGDSVVVKAGKYSDISLSGKKYSQKQPLVIMTFSSDTVLVSGNTISKGCSLEINNCSYIIIEGLTFINSMWGIYVKGSEHIIIRNNEIYDTGQEGCHIGRSSRFIDVTGNKIHNTGQYNSKWAEGIYIGSGSYSPSNFPDNCEYIWIEGNHIYETGNAEGINVKGESFHVTVRNNIIHDIHPGTSVQYNQAGITIEGAANSIDNNYRLSESRDIWVENNTIRNVSEGYSDWNNGIMFFGTGVNIVNNTISGCTDKGIFGNNWKNIGLLNHVYGNTISRCGTAMYINPELKVNESDPGKNPHTGQQW